MVAETESVPEYGHSVWIPAYLVAKMHLTRRAAKLERGRSVANKKLGSWKTKRVAWTAPA